jgi:CelD/BcsL family acetyltransferase involved in cellulose biosynthesis
LIGHGAAALADRGDAMDALHDRVRAPVDVRRPWLDVWSAGRTDREPLIISLERLDQGAGPAADGPPVMAAVAPLASRSIGPVRSLVALGHGFSDHCSVACLDADAASELGAAVRSTLDEARRPWVLTLARLPAEDERTHAFIDGLGQPYDTSEVSVAPQVVFDEQAELTRYESRNTRAMDTRSRNKIRAMGKTLETEVFGERDRIHAAVPELVRLHRERDLQLRGSSALDDPREARIYRGIIERHADLGLVRILEIRIDGDLAAFVVGIIDRGTVRIYDNRVSPDFLDYRAGSLANSGALRAAFECPHVKVLDWGSGDQRYKRSSATHLIPNLQLRAWSSVRSRRAWEAGHAGLRLRHQLAERIAPP